MVDHPGRNRVAIDVGKHVRSYKHCTFLLIEGTHNP